MKVLDFGLAKQFQETGNEVDTEAETLHVMTIAGAVIGTPAYMSPEQAMGEHVDARADIFSFGAIAYEMLTGQRAFTGATLAAVMQAVVAGNPPSPRRVRPEVPVELDALVMRSLQKKKGQRQLNAQQVINEIGEINTRRTARSSMLATSPMHGLRHISWQLHNWRREHKRAALVTSALVVVLIVGAVGTIAIKRRSAVIPGANPNGGLARLDASASPYELFQQGIAYLDRYDREENINAAAQAFQTALAKDQKYAPAYAGLGTLYLLKYQANRDKQLLETALQNAKQAVELDGHLTVGRVSLGRVYAEKGDYEQAEKELRQALTLDPLNAGAHRGLGDVERGKKNWSEAEKLYRKAIELNPKDWDLRLALGSLYFRAARYPDAEKAFAEAVRLAPDSFIGYRNLGGVYHMQGRFAEASSEYQKALQIKPTPSTYSNLGTSLFFQGLYQQAVMAMEKAIQLGANNHQIWGNLGDAYRWTPGNAEKAKEAYQTAIQMIRSELTSKPTDADLRSRLDLYLVKSGEKQEALNDAVAVERIDKSASVLARLVSVYEIGGQRQRALETMAAALQAGYSMDEFRRDPELLELRKDPGFLRLVAAVPGKPSG